MVTVSAIVGLILSVTVPLAVFVVLDFCVMVNVKVKLVSADTFGARRVALGLLAEVRLIVGVEGEVCVQAKVRSLSAMPEALFEPVRTTSVPTRRALLKARMLTTGAGELGASGLGVDEGVGVGVALGFGISAGLQDFEGAGGLAPGKGDRGPYCLPLRKSP